MEPLRALLTTYAYNILGSLEEAKDIVQDAYLQFMRLDEEDIREPKAYLIRTVINLSVNRKHRQQKLRAAYYGEWLPEPVATERADTMLDRKDVLSYSLMVLLEKLDARQRAVFILKEAFDYEHAEIAAVLDITAEHSRKILSRAKKQLALERNADRQDASAADMQKYLEVIRQGDVTRLERMLYEDVVLKADGGGKVTASKYPVCGRKSVMAMQLGIFRKFYADAAITISMINHQPAFFIFIGDQLVSCQIFTFAGDRISELYIVRNPDKLRTLQKHYDDCRI
ncbi:sigma-70 family RNA polymerase sigma factor [Chitinophaga sp. XS-30]|uniref:sigma-70 family RNA polymerase sigma factor n=1 Tax=Chitinophaga sp. XS-30 TaxID=2604421 RepID=UPI0011DDF1A6|nr:sigma-70 family RNA polymerase sigma factor [Chitinophaga sp. XS-30]QEH42561.1 sigma-70 family RNA polymerase sigma factor [Chitinophaga sp. XS-30]